MTKMEPAGAKVKPAKTTLKLSRRIIEPVQEFLHTEVAGGAVILAAAVAALVWANSPWSASYFNLWHIPVELRFGPLHLTFDLHHWINDMLMTVFFFVVGMEIKREMVHGELRDPRAAALPVACAVGGMVAPALIYLAVAGGTEAAAGWGVPMATDIAFSLGALALLGSRVPPVLKIFLLSLAIVDDIGAILVIALFYSGGIQGTWLAGAAGLFLLLVVLLKLQVRAPVLNGALALAIWFAVYKAGIHPTIAGVALGLIAPAWPRHETGRVIEDAQKMLAGVRDPAPGGRADEPGQSALLAVSRMTREAISPLSRLEAAFHPWSAFLVLPLFALANAGVALRETTPLEALQNPAGLGVVLGLVLGKPVGIVATAFLAIRLRLSRMPPGVGWMDLVGLGALAGIGFTVSIFIANLAFRQAATASAATLGILLASLAAGILGMLILWLSRRAR